MNPTIHPFMRAFVRPYIQIAALAALWLSAPAAPARDVFKWTDANGKIHYGDKAATGGSTARKMEINAKTPEADIGSAERGERTQKLLNQYEDERTEAETAKADREKEESIRKHNCEIARDKLERYKTAAFLYDKDKNGERVILSNEERTKAEADTQKQVDQWCKPLS